MYVSLTVVCESAFHDIPQYPRRSHGEEVEHHDHGPTASELEYIVKNCIHFRSCAILVTFKIETMIVTTMTKRPRTLNKLHRSKHLRYHQHRISLKSIHYVVFGIIIFFTFSLAQYQLSYVAKSNSNREQGSYTFAHPSDRLQQQTTSSQLIKPMYVRIIDEYRHGDTNSIKRIEKLSVFPRTIFINDVSYVSASTIESDYSSKKSDLCTLRNKWQTKSFPTCNILHECDLSDEKSGSIIGEGSYRSVWGAESNFYDEIFALKTLRYERLGNANHFPRHIERHNIDALAMERLTKSAFVVDIYSFCGNSGIFEFSTQGSLNSYRRIENRTAINNFNVIFQAARALADFHGMDIEYPSIVHNDIKPSQFVLIDGVYKLNDFNKAQFIPKNTITNKPCMVKNVVPKSSGTFRSPEEFAGKTLNEKVDIYAFGNTVYTILTGQWPFQNENNIRVHNRVIRGERAKLPEEITTSRNPCIQALVEVFVLSQEQEVTERISADEIVEKLRSYQNACQSSV